jgi:tyrosyl-tRNA synthetase
MSTHSFPPVEEQIRLLERGLEEVVPVGGLREKLLLAEREKRPLRVKLGIDPTASDIHLGFAVVLRKLRQFQDCGHTVVLIIGDFTATIGDPSGKSRTRPMLDRDAVREHARTYEQQLYAILDPNRTEVRFNGDWLGAMTFADVVRLSSQYTVARLLERDDFANRFRSGEPIHMHELLYPLCQGYDSVAVRADIELGGTDQKFNNLVGRDLQREAGQEPQAVVLMPLLVGTDGVEKMSKSLGNYVGIRESPNEQFGKLMSVPDSAMVSYYRLATDVPTAEVAEIERRLAQDELHPMDAKLRLAREIVTMYHDAEAARAAEEEFLRVFRQREMPEEIPDLTVPSDVMRDGNLWIVRLLTHAKFAASNREARQLVEQGAVSLNEHRVADPNLDFVPEEGMVLRVGKRRFARLRLEG